MRQEVWNAVENIAMDEVNSRKLELQEYASKNNLSVDIDLTDFDGIRHLQYRFYREEEE